MNKTDLINQLAERLDGDKKTAQAAVEGFIDLVQREVQKRPERLDLRLRRLREACPGRANRAQSAHGRGRQGQEDHRARVPSRASTSRTSSPAR